jgi:hypothetical protein
MDTTHIYEFNNFVSPEICDTIVNWFKDADTVERNAANDYFNGKTIDYKNINNYEIKRLVNSFKFDATVKAREIFDEPELYPDYTDLVLWGPGSGMLVHSDNSDLEGNPNYCSWRAFSAVCYLNDDYLGGETFFPTKGPLFIKPKKGKMVFYPSSLEFRHGVTTVVGTRYTIPIWFTKDRDKAEI